MARNPYGEVALGQEGSGLAQIFTPYDATKFDRAVVASGEEQKKEDAKAAKEISLSKLILLRHKIIGIQWRMIIQNHLMTY